MNFCTHRLQPPWDKHLTTSVRSACRKRRIKCDEARPTCGNCIKSKRQCEGYNQRVIFKDPLGAFAPFGPLVYPQPTPQTLIREQRLSVAQQKSTSASHQIIAPKPPPIGYVPGAIPRQFNHVFPNQAAPLVSPPLNLEPNYYGVQSTSTSSNFTFFPPETIEDFSQNHWRQESDQVKPQLDYNRFSPVSEQGVLRHVSPVAPHQSELLEQYNGLAQVEVDARQISDPQYAELQDAEYEDDASMADSEEDGPVSRREQSQFELNELGLIVSQRLHDRYDSFSIQPRTFAFHAENILAIYEPSPGNSPLNDKQIASVFWHFVNVTGPSISLYERHPFDTTHQGPNTKPRQHIWTCE